MLRKPLYRVFLEQFGTFTYFYFANFQDSAVLELYVRAALFHFFFSKELGI